MNGSALQGRRQHSCCQCWSVWFTSREHHKSLEFWFWFLPESWGSRFTLWPVSLHSSPPSPRVWLLVRHWHILNSVHRDISMSISITCVYCVTPTICTLYPVELVFLWLAPLYPGGLDLKSQEVALRAGPDVLIATPGRLIDHLHNTPSFELSHIEILILDEADRWPLTFVVQKKQKDKLTWDLHVVHLVSECWMNTLRSRWRRSSGCVPTIDKQCYSPPQCQKRYGELYHVIS